MHAWHKGRGIITDLSYYLVRQGKLWIKRLFNARTKYGWCNNNPMELLQLSKVSVINIKPSLITRSTSFRKTKTKIWIKGHAPEVSPERNSMNVGRKMNYSTIIPQSSKYHHGFYNKGTYPQWTVIDSFILKDSFLCFKEGNPPKSEPPCRSVLIGFSSRK